MPRNWDAAPTSCRALVVTTASRIASGLAQRNGHGVDPRVVADYAVDVALSIVAEVEEAMGELDELDSDPRRTRPTTR